jgi:hypothetical protein
MKNLFSLLILAFVFAGCQKSGNENKPEVEVKKTEVTFAVTDFAQSVKGFADVNTKGTMAVGDTLSNYADNLYYTIYATDGSYVKSGTQTKTDATFGRITEQLVPGTYDVYIAASRNMLAFFAGSGSTYGTASISPPATNLWLEFFSKNMNVTVAGTPLTQSVRLDRAVGALDVVLTDEMPASVAKVSVIIANEAADMLIKTGVAKNYGSTTRDFALTAADAGIKNKKFSMLIGNTATDINITLQAFDASGTKIAEKLITTRVNKNQRTTLSGSLIGPAAAGFTVYVNPLWNTPGSVITF